MKLLNYYFFSKDQNAVKVATYVDMIEKIHAAGRDNVAKISDLVQVTELRNFVICDLRSVEGILGQELSSYTGLIANRLTEKYGKTAIVFTETPDFYKGSVRDKYGRNYLRVFRQICYAGGHNSAFGFKLPLLELQRFLKVIEVVDKEYSQKTHTEQQIMVECKDDYPNLALLYDMAVYNEFAGGELPYAYVTKVMDSSIVSKWTRYGVRYVWGAVNIKSDHALGYGVAFCAKSILRKSVTLMV